jgi:hypothetical protein
MPPKPHLADPKAKSAPAPKPVGKRVQVAPVGYSPDSTKAASATIVGSASALSSASGAARPTLGTPSATSSSSNSGGAGGASLPSQCSSSTAVAQDASCSNASDSQSHEEVLAFWNKHQKAAAKAVDMEARDAVAGNNNINKKLNENTLSKR